MLCLHTNYTMLYRPSSFRKTAFALTTAAALAGASVLASFPANAQQAVNYRTTPDCTTVKESGLRAICESFQRTEAAKRRGAAADVRLENANNSLQQAQGATTCMDEVGKKIEAAKKAGPLSHEQKSLFRAQIERCDKG